MSIKRKTDKEVGVYIVEKAMATHSSTLAWKIPWMEEPGRLQSMGLQSRTWLSDFTLTFHFYALEKEMATHSSVLTWRIPGMGEPGGLPSMGSHRVGHDWSNLAAAAATFSVMKVSQKCTSPILFRWRSKLVHTLKREKLKLSGSLKLFVVQKYHC